MPLIWFYLMIFDFLLFLERMWWTSRTTCGSWRFVGHICCGDFFSWMKMMNSITINLWPYAVLQYNSEHAMVTGSWPRHRHTVQKSIYPKLMAKILGMAKIWQGQMSFLHACRIGIGNAQDLYLAGRLLPKNGHFQIHGDGSSSFQKDGVRLVTVYGFCRVCPFFFFFWISADKDAFLARVLEGMLPWLGTNNDAHTEEFAIGSRQIEISPRWR